MAPSQYSDFSGARSKSKLPQTTCSCTGQVKYHPCLKRNKESKIYDAFCFFFSQEIKVCLLLILQTNYLKNKNVLGKRKNLLRN